VMKMKEYTEKICSMEITIGELLFYLKESKNYRHYADHIENLLIS